MGADLLDRLRATLGPGYALERELGGGGMSRVFLAEEVRLGRRVVVKVLSPELAAGVSGERFQREIRLAASLQQANIVPLLSTGESDGLPYYIMPFVEGLSLRARLERDGRLSIPDAVSVLRDVARALAYAHDHGVVHRDIKPENVLLSGDAAVVTDFGIAKAVSASRTGPASATLTRDGTGIGTPAYMAPEQATGDPRTDHRADFYAFGCMAYELLAGEPPFHDLPVHRLIAAHLSQAAVPLSTRRPEVPATLATLIATCLAKDPEQRPGSARELLAALERVPTGALPAARPHPRRALAVGATLVVLAGAGAATLRFIRSTRTAGADTPVSLAILPFAAAGDTTQAYRAEGLTDQIQAAARQLPRLRLVSRTAANRWQGQRVDIQTVGKTLGVAYVLRGTFRAEGTRLRVVASLSRTSDGEDLWGPETLEPVARDPFAAEDEIRNAIIGALQARFPGGGRALVGAVGRGTADPIAWDLYERGMYLLRRRGSGIAIAARRFEEAIARDSTFARAWAGLSEALALLPNFVDTTFAAVNGQAMTAARRALALDSSLAEARTSLGLAHMQSFRWAEADSAFRGAIAAQPDEPSAHFHYARYLAYTGRLAGAVAELERTRQLDPTSAVAAGWLAGMLLLVGRQPEAIREADRALELDSLGVPTIHFVAQVRIAAGQPERARALIEREPQISPWLGAAAWAYAAMGDRPMALRLKQRIETSRWRSFRESALATVAIALRDSAAALDAFERATAAGEFWPSAPILADPLVLDVLGKSPRFAALLRRIGLDISMFSPPGPGR